MCGGRGGRKGWSVRGSKGRGKRGRGVDDVNYGRLSSSSAWISKKQSVHRGRSACPATRKRDALPPVHRNRTRLPRFAAPPASRCINTAKGGRSRPRTRSRYSKRELLAFIAIIVVVLLFLFSFLFHDKSPFAISFCFGCWFILVSISWKFFFPFPGEILRGVWMKRYRYFFFFLMKYIGDRELDVPCDRLDFFQYVRWFIPILRW